MRMEDYVLRLPCNDSSMSKLCYVHLITHMASSLFFIRVEHQDS